MCSYRLPMFVLFSGDNMDYYLEQFKENVLSNVTPLRYLGFPLSKEHSFATSTYLDERGCSNAGSNTSVCT